MTDIQIGDLVQFNQKQSAKQPCWPTLPNSYDQFKWVQSARYITERPNVEYSPFGRIAPTETKKVPMIVKSSRILVFTNSTVPHIRQALTKEFVEVMVFKTTGTIANCESFWVLKSDIVPYTDKSYMDEFKLRIKQQLLEQKMSNAKK